MKLTRKRVIILLILMVLGAVTGYIIQTSFIFLLVGGRLF